jgi:hypothetical protein
MYQEFLFDFDRLDVLGNIDGNHQRPWARLVQDHLGVLCCHLHLDKGTDWCNERECEALARRMQMTAQVMLALGDMGRYQWSPMERGVPTLAIMKDGTFATTTLASRRIAGKSSARP